MKTFEQQQTSSTVALQALPVPPKRLMAVANVVVRWLLRSPLHFLLSDSLLLLTYWGWKSGKRCTHPVSYTREGGRHGDRVHVPRLVETGAWQGASVRRDQTAAAPRDRRSDQR